MVKALDQHAQSLHVILPLSHKSYQGEGEGFFSIPFVFLCFLVFFVLFSNVTPRGRHFFLIVIQVHPFKGRVEGKKERQPVDSLHITYFGGRKN